MGGRRTLTDRLELVLVLEAHLPVGDVVERRRMAASFFAGTHLHESRCHQVERGL